LSGLGDSESHGSQVSVERFEPSAGLELWKRPTGGRDEIQGRNSPSGTLQLWQGFIRMTSSTL
jgi:hypothetical protein